MSEVKKWMARHEPLPSVPLPSLAEGRTRADSGPVNAQGSSSSAASAGTADCAGRCSSDGSSSSSSGRSEEGTSAAWRLCAWLQRAGWPAQHCASIRSGSSSNGGSSGGWHFCSGHEFLVLHPDLCAAGGRASSTPASSSSDDDSGGDVRMRSAKEGPAADPTPASALVVDPEFSTQFALASPSPRYALLVSLLPRAFVGSYARLQRLVEWVCCEMRASFQAAGSGLPPWRSLAHVLNKWRLEEGSGQAALSPAEAPPLPSSCPSWGGGDEQHGTSEPQPGASAAAFSVERQHAMRQLLLHQALQAAPPPRQALTASSSASSMDGASLPSHTSCSLPAPEEVAQSRGRQHTCGRPQSQHRAHPGPAAAILGMAQGGGL